MKRKIMLALIGGLLAASTFGGVASAKVHGITPLLDISVDSSNSGGAGTNGTPADAASGGPVAGLIPATTGDALLAFGDGGFGATDGNAP